MKKNIKGRIAEIQTLGLLDGPGIRTVVFLQGCPLRCLYCHNPEMQDMDGDIKEYTPEELVTFLKRYKPYYKDNGGVTFSGGEPLTQRDFLLETLKLCKQEGIHTCLDTSGFGVNYDEILDYTDLVIMDIKACNSELYTKITKQKIETSLKFLETCQRKNKKMWLRQVIVPGVNDSIEQILELKTFISNLKNIERVELLPYHTMAKNKYEKLGRVYPLGTTPAMDEKRCKELEDLLKKK